MKHKLSVGQKLICDVTVHNCFTKGRIYELLPAKRQILGDYFIIDDDGEEESTNWTSLFIKHHFIDATKLNSQIEFNSKFDDWVNK